MDNEFFEGIMTGLNEALEYTKGDKTKGRSRTITILPLKEYSKEEIKELRKKHNMTLAIFAEYMGVSQKAVEAWEAGTNKPSGSSVRLIQLLEADENIFREHMIVRS